MTRLVSNNWRVTADGKTEPVYLCRCGVEHVGPDAAYDYGHHMCFHEARLLNLGHGQVVCPDCGRWWLVEDDMRPEYDIRGWARGKYLPWYRQIIEYLKALYR